jgi:Xaa-Pro aminopeptidase
MDKSTNDILAPLLLEAGIAQSAEAIRDIIKGVAAGPAKDGAIGKADNWLELIGPNLPGPLVEALADELILVSKIDDGLTTAARNDPAQERLADLRQELKSQNISGFIIPLADEYQGEYVPKNAQRLAWLTGFTGSAGLAIVLENKAAIFVDGRYTLQAGEQVDGLLYEINHLVDNPADKWLSETLNSGDILGYDPWLHTSDGVIRLQKAVEKAGAKYTPLGSNPIDAVWANQPPPPLTPATLQDLELTGRSSADKRQEISALLKNNGLTACVLTAPDSIAWLANIRGGDVPYTPFSLGFAIIYADTHLDIYSDPRKFSTNLIAEIEEGISVNSREEFLPTLQGLGGEKAKIGIDPSTAADILSQTLKSSGAQLQRFVDPCQLPKARKNAAELDGMRQAHLRDAVALTRFLAWLDENAESGNLTEMSVADQLEKYRREGDKIQGLSFPTISGAGPNGAIVHYRVTTESDRKLDQNSLYLVDSGAQYFDGTTDVTRTIAIGTPSAEMKDRFTRVLKGHIALASAVFPAGTSGSQLDVLARAPLWQIGLDYDHGTGHGVGSYLGVHEGPHRISKMPNRIALEPGMVVSNEPGYYKTGEYGIRIENLVAVIPAPRQNSKLASDKRPLLCFETLTLAPIDLSLVVQDLLNEQEIEWLNNYHQKVETALQPLLDAKTQKWLELNSNALNYT